MGARDKFGRWARRGLLVGAMAPTTSCTLLRNSGSHWGRDNRAHRMPPEQGVRTMRMKTTGHGRKRQTCAWRTLAVLILIGPLSTGCVYLQRASISSNGTQGNGNSLNPAISGDGRYVAFVSWASNLVPGDTNGLGDVFVRDHVTGTTTRVSVDSNGNQANSYSREEPAISADGRYIAFASSASNLVPGDTNITSDVFVRDRVAGTTTRVNVATNGSQANNHSSADTTQVSISADGRYIAFASFAQNLVPEDTNIHYDVFVHDRVTRTTSRVSVDSNGNQADDGNSSQPSISADGRYIAFTSYASNLVPGDTNLSLSGEGSAWDVFVHDRVAGTTNRVSVDSNGNQANLDSMEPAISADGRYVAFVSWASNLVSGDIQYNTPVYVHDRATGTTTAVSVATGFANEGIRPSISGDGRYVAFDSGHALGHVFVRDRVDGITTVVSADSAGNPAASGGRDASISADGRYIAFRSSTSSLVAGDTNNKPDIFVRANPQPVITSVSPSNVSQGMKTSIAINGTGFTEGALAAISNTAGDVSLSEVTVISSRQITAVLTMSGDASLGSRNLVVTHPGTGPGPAAGATGLCTGCMTIIG